MTEFSSFKEKYDIFEFSTTDSYLNLLEKEKVNSFSILIIDCKINSNKSALDLLKICYQKNIKCDFIVIFENFNQEEILAFHNLGAVKLYSKPVSLDILNTNLQDFFYQQHLKNLNQETETICLKIALHTDFFINVLNEFISNKELNQFYKDQFPNEDTTLDFKTKIQSLEEHLYTNIKMRDILLKQNTISFSTHEKLLS